jgi:hypothetical protein
MLRIAIRKVRQCLSLIWHALRKPPVEKVVEEQLGHAPASQVKRVQRRLERSRQRRKVKVS